LLIGFVIALVVLTETAAFAAAPTDQLKQRVDQVIKVLDDPAFRDKPVERRAAVRKINGDEATVKTRIVTRRGTEVPVGRRPGAPMSLIGVADGEPGPGVRLDAVGRDRVA
jgi:hypothetical protein